MLGLERANRKEERHRIYAFVLAPICRRDGEAFWKIRGVQDEDVHKKFQRELRNLHPWERWTSVGASPGLVHDPFESVLEVVVCDWHEKNEQQRHPRLDLVRAHNLGQ